MNTIAKIISLDIISINNITFAMYKCECGNHGYIYVNKYIKYLGKIRICNKCSAFMKGTCIKDDNSMCLNCVKCIKSRDFMCGNCGKIIMHGTTTFLRNEEENTSYKALCNNCYQN